MFIITKEEVINKINILRKLKTETNTIEAKSAKSGFPKRCYDTISSFSNKYGGIIIFGLNEKNNFSADGVYDIDDLQKQLGSLCNDCMEPAIHPDFLPLKFEGKNILAVKIDEINQNIKPCYYKPKGMFKGSYIRVGERDDVMTDYELYNLHSYKENILEDLRPIKRSSFSDLNIEKIRKYIRTLRENKPNFSKNDDKKILKMSGIIEICGRKTYPTLAGLMLFGNYPQEYFPQLFIACCVIPGKNLGDRGVLGQRFDDNKRIEGTIDEMLQESLVFLRKNMKKKVIIDSKTGLREDVTEYPIEALREAIANALIHRDYSSQTEGAYIQVYMYDDRIEILSPGTLYGTNKIEELGTTKMLQIRNKTILKILEESNSLVENRHTGIPTMKREMEKYGLPTPIFVEERNCFKVIFKNNNINNIYISEQVSEQVGEQVGEQVSEQVGEQVSEQVSEQVGEQVRKKTSKKQVKYYRQKIIEYCKEPKSAKEISEYLGIKSRSYISVNIINPLLKLELIEYTNKKSINASNQKYVSK